MSPRPMRPDGSAGEAADENELNTAGSFCQREGVQE